MESHMSAGRISELRRQAMFRVKGAAKQILLEMPFQERGLSDRTIETLVKHGVDAPERLLFMAEAELRNFPGIDEASLREIGAYVLRFWPRV
jgi:DNA-directed RNA polymerase alpha subunit